ncbi:hypothetical protein [Thalassobacillus sp. C254]|uniref:hypothetical protein n=1 Tax=Thalassobacillus sp. C254 TaxID=1225341 RepID=UPI0006CFFFCA|nr:hypothetical protein [Thalassobacillus sp. C254]
MKIVVSTMAALLGILIILGFFVSTSLYAPSVRVIIDHTNQTYVSPPCFEEAELTNNLQEVALEHAVTLGYEAEAECTSDSLVEEDVPLNLALLKEMGIVPTKWAEWPDHMAN